MEDSDFTRVCPSAQAGRPLTGPGPAVNGETRERREETTGTGSQSLVAGVIVDSWVEPAPPAAEGARLVLQVATRDQPDVLVTVEAEASLISDRVWLEDLSENLCHGSPVRALGSRSLRGAFLATRLELTR